MPLRQHLAMLNKVVSRLAARRCKNDAVLMLSVRRVEAYGCFFCFCYDFGCRTAATALQWICFLFPLSISLPSAQHICSFSFPRHPLSYLSINTKTV